MKPNNTPTGAQHLRQTDRETVEANRPYIRQLSREICRYRQAIRDSFLPLLVERAATGDCRSRQIFYSADGAFRVRIHWKRATPSHHRIAIGLAMIRSYACALPCDPRHAPLSDEITALLYYPREKNGIGTEALTRLKQLAEQSADPSFAEGVEILIEARRPEITILKMEAEYRNDRRGWSPLPLAF